MPPPHSSSAVYGFERLAPLGKAITQIVPLSIQEYKWVPGR